MRPRRRRHRHRAALAVGVVGLTGIAVLGALFAVAQPHLTWRLQRSDNRLGLRLEPGAGPLAAFVLGLSAVRVAGWGRGSSGGVQQLWAGERLHEQVAITGPLRRTVTVALRVPPAPRLRRSRLGARSLELRFDLPLAGARESGRSPGPGTLLTGGVVRLVRTARTRTVPILLTAGDGEEARLAVRVPGLQAVSWTVGPLRLDGRVPLLVRFAEPMRWRLGAALRLTPGIAGRWTAVGAESLRFLPRAPWPSGGRLVVELSAPSAPLAIDGALPESGGVTLQLVRHRRARARPRATPPPPPGGAVAPVYSFGNPSGRRIYLTIDDGWSPSVGVLRLMRRERVPLTTFLIADAVADDIPFWRAFVAAGGVVEDHTVSHPDLDLLSAQGVFLQWAVNRVRLQRWLRTLPTIGRPPYGDADRQVLRAAARAGLRGLVLWSATDIGGRIQTWNGDPLQAGEIVLLHWVPGVAGVLQRLLAVIQARHLVPAPLLAGLP